MFEVKVGQEVGFAHFHGWGTLLSSGRSKIIKINKYGHILLENGLAFDKHGNDRADFSRLKLMEITMYESMLKKVQTQKDRNALVKKITEIMAEKKHGDGNYSSFDLETVARLQDMIGRLV